MIVATWQKCVYSLKDELPSQQFNTWIKPLKAVGGGNRLLLLAPNRFVQEWVNDNFLERIREIVHFHAEQHVQTPASLEVILEIITNQKGLNEVLSTADLMSTSTNADDAIAAPLQANEPEAGSGVTPERTQQGHSPADTQVMQAAQQDLLDEAVIGFPDAREAHNNRQGSEQKANPKPHAHDKSRRLRYRGELSESYTFSNFIEGKSNQLARAASAQVANNPGGAYNPLFIYGGVGLGKTHLMHAIGNHMRKQNPGANVIYLHSQTFVHSMVSALQLNAINEFKRYYHSVDALLIDDIQFFANKERSQEEFFHTFNAIFEGGRQIILTCDKYYNQINGLEERLKSRFGWGLSVAVEPPELETRAAILINKANRDNIYLPNEGAMFMAQKLRSNVRELEGALKKVVAHSRFVGEDISVPLIKEALKDLLAIQNKLVTIDNIQRTVAEYYKIKMSDMLSKRRSRSVARPRQMAMCLSKELTNHSLPEIGNLYGGRDHTTVMHACRTINDLRKSSVDINEDYQNLLRSLSS